MINGSVLVGTEERQSAARFHAIHPASAQASTLTYSESDARDVADACELAAEAFPSFSGLEPDRRAAFLQGIADAIDDVGDALITTAMAETGLPRARLEGERSRTTSQLQLFAEEVRAGSWMDIVVDPALPDRSPLPRPDLRRINQPLGPVAVFGASNFPLAFSVAGGDTASALAAGCPVVVKGHPAHPGTGELVARAVLRAAAASGLHRGVFSFLPGSTHELGAALVSHPHIKAVGFTGSRGGGLALARIAAERAEPIPVYAEMSSINPIILMPAALDSRAEELAEAFVTSLTMGAGQFCTNPGLILATKGASLDRFVRAASSAIERAAAQVMLTPAIRQAYQLGMERLSSHPDVKLAKTGAAGSTPCAAAAALFVTDAAAFLDDRSLAHEVFGASAIVVGCADMEELEKVVTGLDGQLTASLQLDPADELPAARLVPLLATKAGRVLANGWPTGVEVCRAMVHGGPFPATTDPRSTSVGTLAMMRFLRPVCYQNMPEALLPVALQ